MVAALAFVAAYAPGASWSGSEGVGGTTGPPSGNLTINFGTAISASTPCADGRTITVEDVPWMSASPALSTGEVVFELVELIDGDIDGGPTPAPGVTPSYVCGAPLATPWASWYLVLQGPAGLNLGYYSYSQGWVDLGSPGSAVPIADGSTLIFVSSQSFAGLSFGLCAVGVVGGPLINVCAPL